MQKFSLYYVGVADPKLDRSAYGFALLDDQGAERSVLAQRGGHVAKGKLSTPGIAALSALCHGLEVVRERGTEAEVTCIGTITVLSKLLASNKKSHADETISRGLTKVALLRSNLALLGITLRYEAVEEDAAALAVGLARDALREGVTVDDSPGTKRKA